MTRRPGRRPYSRHASSSQPEQRVANVHIESIASGGDGVGRIEGIACFVPRTAPGDEVQAALAMRARHARGRVLQVITPSPSRIEPTCQHYEHDQCGGCQLQHIDINAQRAAKSQIVRDAMQRIGKRDIPLPAVEPSPSAWHYRRKFTLTLVRRGQSWIGGFHPLDNPNAVFPLVECTIADPRLIDVWKLISQCDQALPDSNTLRVMVRLVDAATTASAVDATSNVASFAVVITGGMQWSNAVAFADSLPGCVALWWHDDAGNRHVIRAPEEQARTSASFVQVNRQMANVMFNHVNTAVRSFSPTSVVDAYAGIGQLSLSLAQSGIQVTAIEWDRDAVASLERQLPGHSRAIASSVEAVIAECLPADVVVLNPPRTGVDAAVTTALADSARHGVRAIVYVSCDPATLARDLTRLDRWRIHQLHCFDMFPQTAHVETMCVLVPEAA